MRRIGSVLAALGLLLVTACAPKPELISAEQIARPHVASIIETDPQVILDPGRPATSLSGGPMVGAPLVAVAVGALLVGAAQGWENARANTRRTSAQALKEQLGPTSEVGSELQRQFRSALNAEIARGTRMPIQRVESRPASWQPSPQTEPMLNFQISSMLTQDARSVAIQALVTQLSWKPGEKEPVLLRYDLVAFSAPIEAASEGEAIAFWQTNNHARLRQAMRELIPEIMVLLRISVLDPAPIAMENMPQISTKLPSFGLVLHGRRTLHDGGNYIPSVKGTLVRRSQERAYLTMQTNVPMAIPYFGMATPGLAWLSVPAGSL
jgi:hypothetical protein